VARRRFDLRRQLARVRGAETLSLMRSEGLPLKAAAQRAHTDPRTVRRHFGVALSKDPRGRWLARGDRETFDMLVVSTRGVVERRTRGSGSRSLIGAHHAAVARFLRPGGGDVAVLRPFSAKRAAGVELETNPDRLVEYWREGQLDFLEIYLP
jgi:hypothetical protein